MPRLVEADRFEASSLPGALCAAPEVRRDEGRLRARAEYEPAVATLTCLVVDKEVAERADDRNRAAARSALRLDLDPALVVVGALNADHAGGEVDVVPAKGHQLTAPQPGVQRRRPH